MTLRKGKRTERERAVSGKLAGGGFPSWGRDDGGMQVVCRWSGRGQMWDWKRGVLELGVWSFLRLLRRQLDGYACSHTCCSASQQGMGGLTSFAAIENTEIHCTPCHVSIGGIYRCVG